MRHSHFLSFEKYDLVGKKRAFEIDYVLYLRVFFTTHRTLITNIIELVTHINTSCEMDILYIDRR